MGSILDDFKMAFKTGNVLNQIIVINVVVFALLLLLRAFFFFGEQDDTLSLINSFFEFDPRLENLLYRPWTVITYGFTHFEPFHILFNMLFLFWFGRIITSLLGQNKLLGLYIWGVISGSLAYLLIYNTLPRGALLAGDYPQMIGASAGVFAVMVGAAAFQPNTTFNLILLGSIKIKYIAAFYILLSLSGVTGGNSGGEIAHLAGALVGYLGMTQLQKGNDWSKPVVGFVSWIKNLFKPQPKIKVSYRSENKSKTKTTSSKRRTAKPKPTEQTSQQEIDAILDKISDKGYDALSKEEKQKLFNASKD